MNVTQIGCVIEVTNFGTQSALEVALDIPQVYVDPNSLAARATGIESLVDQTTIVPPVAE